MIFLVCTISVITKAVTTPTIVIAFTISSLDYYIKIKFAIAVSNNFLFPAEMLTIILSIS